MTFGALAAFGFWRFFVPQIFSRVVRSARLLKLSVSDGRELLPHVSEQFAPPLSVSVHRILDTFHFPKSGHEIATL